jgi:hypothetical protein
MSQHYASGAYRRLAEENGDKRVRELSGYENGPTQDELIDELVSNGFTREVAQEAVERLWTAEIAEETER